MALFLQAWIYLSSMKKIEVLEDLVDALKILGISPEEAHQAGRLFEEHDEENLRKLAEVWGDDKKYGIAVQKGLQELKQVLKEDAKDRAKQARNEH